jgi:hypothetical protein
MATFEEQMKEWMAEGRKRFEEMQVQFSLGKMDATDAFEKQKDFLKNAATQWKENLDKATDVAEEQGTKLKSKLDELMLQLNLGKAEGKEQFEEQKKKIEAALHEVYEASKKAYNENHDKLVKLFDSNAHAFKTGIEIIQLQFALAKMDVKEDMEKAGKEIGKKMEELSSHYAELQKNAMHTIEDWNKQMIEGYHKIQDWMKDFVKSK